MLRQAETFLQSVNKLWKKILGREEMYLTADDTRTQSCITTSFFYSLASNFWYYFFQILIGWFKLIVKETLRNLQIFYPSGYLNLGNVRLKWKETSTAG